MIKFFITIAILGFIWTVIIEPYILTVKHINFHFDGLKIVFLSDLHIKPYEIFRLKRIVKLVNEQNPDLVLFGGDFVNSHNKKYTLSVEKISTELGKIKSKYGKFAVLGNHDGWQGANQIINALEAAGIKVLQNENVHIKGVTVAGVEDIQTGNPEIEKSLINYSGKILLLTHSPDIFPQVPDNISLTLAGHTHGGQVVFFRPILVPSKYGKKYAYGIVKEGSKTLYTTRGLGNSILPVRFFCPPEIVVIE